MRATRSATLSRWKRRQQAARLRSGRVCLIERLKQPPRRRRVAEPELSRHGDDRGIGGVEIAAHPNDLDQLWRNFGNEVAGIAAFEGVHADRQKAVAGT